LPFNVESSLLFDQSTGLHTVRLPTEVLQEASVMRCHDDRAGESLNSAFQPLQYIEADIIGWFIQRQ